jgi:tetratricopeptide (TPR) repeat protein
MKTILLFFVLLRIAAFSFAQGLSRPNEDVAPVIKEASRLETSLNEKAALEKFKEALKLQPSNIFVLNKCSELCSRIGKREPNIKTRSAYFQYAKNYAAAALQINPGNADANCAMAIVLGSIALRGSSKEKVDAAKEIKKYVDLALKNDPLNYKAWHVLGRWHFELSDLNIIERAAVKILFGGLPHSTVHDAVKAFEKAGSIKAFAANYIELARAYKKNNQQDKAIASINTLLHLPDQTEDDEAYKSEGRKLLTEWQ